MIIVKGNTIAVSKGDHFLTFFRMKQPYGYRLEGNETFLLNIKKEGNTSPLVKITGQIDVRNNVIMMYATNTEMSKLAIGEYVYDLTMTREDGFHMTMLYPSKFIVKGIVHND